MASQVRHTRVQSLTSWLTARGQLCYFSTNGEGMSEVPCETDEFTTQCGIPCSVNYRDDPDIFCGGLERSSHTVESSGISSTNSCIETWNIDPEGNAMERSQHGLCICLPSSYRSVPPPHLPHLHNLQPPPFCSLNETPLPSTPLLSHPLLTDV